MNNIAKLFFILFGKHTTDGILKSLHRKMDQLKTLEEMKHQESAELTKVANDLLSSASAANSEANKAASVRAKFEALLKPEV